MDIYSTSYSHPLCVSNSYPIRCKGKIEWSSAFTPYYLNGVDREPGRSSSVRWLYMQFWYGTFYMHQYKLSGRYKSVFEHTLLPTGRLPEEEPSFSKHVEDIKKIKIKILT
jgi:hypothetical protein